MPDYTAWEMEMEAQRDRMYQEMREEQHRQEQLAYDRQREEYWLEVEQIYAEKMMREEDKKKHPLFYWNKP